MTTNQSVNESQRELRGFLFSANLQLTDGIKYFSQSQDFLRTLIVKLAEAEDRDDAFFILFTICDELLSSVDNALLKAEKLRKWITQLLGNNHTYWEKITRRKKQFQEISINDVQILLRFLELLIENLEKDIQDFDQSYDILASPVKNINKAIKNLNETNKLLLEVELLLLEPNKTLTQQNWNFITDKELKTIIARDYQELGNLLQINANKSIIVLCGSIMEASLVSVLKEHDEKAKQFFQEEYGKSPGKTESWTLYQLITVANKLGFLDNDTKRQADILRDYRNLIHPAAEIRKATSLDNELIDVQVALLKRVLKSLSLKAI